jgi:hypothetical protein
LTQGKFTVVNGEDYEYLRHLSWSIGGDVKNGYPYARSAAEGRTIRMHRVIMEEAFQKVLKADELVDHINHDTLDNRRENLRVVSRRQNSQNIKTKTTSKYQGVSWDNTAKKWRVRIRINGTRRNVGLFTDELEASKAYKRAVKENCGEEVISSQ